MAIITAAIEAVTRRRIFPSWSIEIPVSFDEAFVAEGSYWHAFDGHRSVSLTSFHDRAGKARAGDEHPSPSQPDARHAC